MANDGMIITGFAEARAVLKAYADAAREHASTKGIGVTADAPYASKMETGKDRFGRVARKAGGVHFLQRAVDIVTHRSLSDALGGNLPDAPAALRGLRLKLANDVVREARRFTDPFPYSTRTRRHTRNLSRSIHVVHGGEGSVLTAPLVGAVARVRRPR